MKPIRISRVAFIHRKIDKLVNKLTDDDLYVNIKFNIPYLVDENVNGPEDVLDTYFFDKWNRLELK